jgi:hypothetical protein
MINARYPFSTTSEAHGVCLERDPGIQSSLKPFLPTMPRDLKYDPAKTYSLTKFCFHYRTANSGQSSIIRLNYETRAYTYKDRRSLSGPPIAFPPLAYFLFDTAWTTDGHISFGANALGRESADAACAADLHRPRICQTAAWAFMSFSAEDEIRDMTRTRNIATASRWYARDEVHDGVLIANNWDDLMDGTIAVPLRDGGVDGTWFWTFTSWGAALGENNCVGGTSVGAHPSGACAGSINRVDVGK